MALRRLAAFTARRAGAPSASSAASGARPLHAPGPQPASVVTNKGGGTAQSDGTTVTPEQRLSVLARAYARTRDAPELLVMYVCVATALSLLGYTLVELIFDTRRGEHVGILLRPDARGDYSRQVEAAGRSAEAAAGRGHVAGSSGPAGGRKSLWYVLGHVMVDEKEGANIGVRPFFNNRAAVRGPSASCARPGGGIGAGGAFGEPPGDAEGSPAPAR